MTNLDAGSVDTHTHKSGISLQQRTQKLQTMTEGDALDLILDEHAVANEATLAAGTNCELPLQEMLLF